MASGSLCAQQIAPAVVEYHFPMDGSCYVPPKAPIIVRISSALSAPEVSSQEFQVSGSLSGLHSGTVTLSDDHRTFVFRPDAAFVPNETVRVRFQDMASERSGQPVVFSYQISPPAEHWTADDRSPFVEQPSTLNLDVTTSLPSDWPAMNVDSMDHPAPGKLFLATFSAATNAGSTSAYRMILDSLANPVYYAKPARLLDFDFKMLPDGRLAYCEGGYVAGSQAIIDAGTKYYIMDSSYALVDSFTVRQDSASYATDFHDFELLPNGHALLLGVDTLPGWNMSRDLPGASTHALFVGAVIEEVDAQKNPVWAWRSWDPGHFNDTDAENENVNLMSNVVDAVHANAIQVDTDGNILLSSRHLDEISKIDRNDPNGSFIWRFGGKHNQFMFVNDAIHFSHQHALRRIANGDLTLFDNGNYGHVVQSTRIFIDSSTVPPTYDTIVTSAPYARACEYRLDIPSKMATLVWHYDHDSTIQSTAMGYVQRLSNGNTLIDWGLAFNPVTGFVDQPTITEVTPNNAIAYELHIASPVYTYRAFKFPWGTSSSAVSEGPGVPPALALGEPFPNPARAQAQVTLSAPVGRGVELELYDALGRHLRTYYSGALALPIETFELPTEGLADGAYELLLRSNGSSVSREFVIQR